MPDPSTQLKTPDPAVTGEAGIAYVASLVAAAVVLFKLNLTDAQQAFLVTLIAAVLAVAIPVAGAIIRKGRAQGNTSR